MLLYSFFFANVSIVTYVPTLCFYLMRGRLIVILYPYHGIDRAVLSAAMVHHNPLYNTDI
jgi:hypothetical protein